MLFFIQNGGIREQEREEDCPSLYENTGPCQDKAYGKMKSEHLCSNIFSFFLGGGLMLSHLALWENVGTLSVKL